MMEFGLVQISAAKADGRWKNAYSASEMKVPADFLITLESKSKAKQFFETLTKSSRYVHPHLGDECKKSKIDSININLVTAGFDPELSVITKELKLSTNALRDKFNELLLIENIAASEIKNAFARFSFNRDSWLTSCSIEVVTNKGLKTEVKVDASGKTVDALPASSHK